MGLSNQRKSEEIDLDILLVGIFVIVLIVALFKVSFIWIAISILYLTLSHFVAENSNDHKYKTGLTNNHLKIGKLLLILISCALYFWGDNIPKEIVVDQRAEEFSLKRTDLMTGLNSTEILFKKGAIEKGIPYLGIADNEFKTAYQNAVSEVKEHENKEEIKIQDDYLSNRKKMVTKIKSHLKANEHYDVVDLGKALTKFNDKEIEKLVAKAQGIIDKKNEEIAKFEAESAAHVEALKSQDLYETKMKHHKTMASIQCQNAVEKILKAPSTADFESYPENIDVDPHTSIFTVRSYVDAQNSFGVIIRNNFICKIYWRDGNPEQWIVKDIQMY